MSPLTRMLFHPADDAILKYEYDDNQKIEPVWYIPIIPMVLVNGADGIGTGWMTKIPNFNPREIVENLKRMIAGEKPKPFSPWYKNFKGTIENGGEQRFVVSGEISIIGHNKLEITELPVHTWTQNYKETVLEALLHGSEKIKPMITDYKEYNTDTTIKFIVTVTPEQMSQLEKEGMHKVFKLQTIINQGSMCAFDDLGCLKKYDSVVTILEDFYTIRIRMYQKRKEFVEGMLEAEVCKLSNQARFILEKCNGQLTVENKKRKTMIEELISKGYEADPVKEWKQKCSAGDDQESDEPEEPEEETTTTTKSKKPVDPEKAFQNLTDVKKFDYLLGMSMWMLTEERKNELLRQRDNKIHELNILKAKTNADLWLDDLNEFLEKLDEVEEKERKDEAGTNAKDSKKVVGKKRINLQETMPSPMAQRVAPVITDDIKKKIQAAIKSKENKTKKGTKKENIASTGSDEDEFDALIQKSSKNLKQKLGTPEGIENKVKQTTLKQTKLNFKKANGSPKKKKKADSDDDISIDGSESDIEFNPVCTPPERARSQRNATKKIKFNEDSESDSEVELHENEAVKENDGPVDKIAINSDSESDTPPLPRHETSEDMFDSLIGKKPADNNQTSSDTVTSKRKSFSGSESECENKTKNKKKKVNDGPKKAAPQKKPLVIESDSDIEFDEMPKNTKAKKKTYDSDSDSDFGEKLAKSKPQKKVAKKKELNSEDESLGKNKKAPAKGKGKKTSDSEEEIVTKKKTKRKKLTPDDDDFDISDSDEYKPPPKTTGRTARAAAQKKYVFSDDDD